MEEKIRRYIGGENKICIIRYIRGEEKKICWRRIRRYIGGEDKNIYWRRR